MRNDYTDNRKQANESIPEVVKPLEEFGLFIESIIKKKKEVKQKTKRRISCYVVRLISC